MIDRPPPANSTETRQGADRPTALRNLAIAYARGGLSLLPCSHVDKRPDAALLPNGNWKPYQATRPGGKTISGWFAKGCKSVGAIGGKVSGGLLVIDFDAEADRFFEAWRHDVGSFADGLPVQRTGGGGYQVCLRCKEPGRNDKLAYVSDETQDSGRAIAIETRAERGYAVMPGSLHPSGRLYEAIAGDFTAIPTVSQDVANFLIAAARKLDEAPLTRQQMQAKQNAAPTSDRHRVESNGQASVIDAYNVAVTIGAELKAHGYVQQGDRWKRPGGNSGSV